MLMPNNIIILVRERNYGKQNRGETLMKILLASDSPTSPLTCPARPSSSPIDASQYSFPNDQPVVTLDARDGGQAGIICWLTMPSIRNYIGHIFDNMFDMQGPTAQGPKVNLT